MATDRQIASNRLNAQKSTGPKTVAGKDASRRNALTHGLTGAGVVTPEAEDAAVEARLQDWAPAYESLTSEQEWALRSYVRESIRIDRCDAEEIALRARSAERAGSLWDEDRRIEAEALGRTLHARPGLVTRQLEATPQGCSWKLMRWESLFDIITAGGDWNEAQRALAIDLLGLPGEFPQTHARLLDMTSDFKTDPESVRLHRGTIARSEADRIRALKNGAAGKADARDRARVAQGVEIETDRPLTRLRRYAAACHRRFLAAAKLLKPTRAAEPRPTAPPPAPVEPDDDFDLDHEVDLDATPRSPISPPSPPAPIVPRLTLP